MAKIDKAKLQSVNTEPLLTLERSLEDNVRREIESRRQAIEEKKARKQRRKKKKRTLNS